MPADLMIFRDPKRTRDAYKITNHPYAINPYPASVYRMKAKSHGVDEKGRHYVRFSGGYGYKRHKTEYIPIFWDSDVAKSLKIWIEERGGSGDGYGNIFVTKSQEDALLIFMAFC